MFLNLGFKNVLMLRSCLPSFSLEGIFITEEKNLKIEYFKWKFSHTLGASHKCCQYLRMKVTFHYFWGQPWLHLVRGQNFMLSVLNWFNMLGFSSMWSCLIRETQFSNSKKYLCSVKYVIEVCYAHIFCVILGFSWKVWFRTDSGHQISCSWSDHSEASLQT